MSEAITDFGVVTDLEEATYHAHPALSCSGAKKLLPPSCPAIFKWERDNPPEPKDVFDFGSAAHRMILGVGPDIVAIEASDWRTNAAKERREEIRTAGAIPILAADHERVVAMTKALYEHPLAAALLARTGLPEVSLFWTDEETGTPLRGRLDYLPDTDAGRVLVTDYKTCASANPDKFARAAADYGYHMQAPWYLDALTALNIAEDAAFLFIAQEKTAPYLVSVIELDSEALRIGRERNRTAIDTYVACCEADVWPAYTDDVALVSLPRWAA